MTYLAISYIDKNKTKTFFSFEKGNNKKKNILFNNLIENVKSQNFVVVVVDVMLYQQNF